ncbi:MAG TPA: hypothetical protein PKC14_05100 [Candidatus Absconditabacterales bacterium]|nr:hypothetical protein [Candidatus Absconditabacterales bacterium]
MLNFFPILPYRVCLHPDEIILLIAFYSWSEARYFIHVSAKESIPDGKYCSKVTSLMFLFLIVMNTMKLGGDEDKIKKMRQFEILAMTEELMQIEIKNGSEKYNWMKSNKQNRKIKPKKIELFSPGYTKGRTQIESRITMMHGMKRPKTSYSMM